MVLDINDFIVARGGDPERIRQSQRRRNAPEAVVDDIILMFEATNKGKNMAWWTYENYELTLWIAKYAAQQIGSQLNTTQKEIGKRKKANEDAAELLQKKVKLEAEKKVLEDSAKEKDAMLQKKLKTVGNYVHDSVPISNNEVSCSEATSAIRF